jgi:hypothetical protein
MGRAAWAVVSVAGVAISWLVSVTFPYFSTVMAVIAALGDLAGAYALPALFVLVSPSAGLVWQLIHLCPSGGFSCLRCNLPGL